MMSKTTSGVIDILKAAFPAGEGLECYRMVGLRGLKTLIGLGDRGHGCRIVLHDVPT